jgi:hypothetical protein
VYAEIVRTPRELTRQRDHCRSMARQVTFKVRRRASRSAISGVNDQNPGLSTPGTCLHVMVYFLAPVSGFSSRSL